MYQLWCVASDMPSFFLVKCFFFSNTISLHMRLQKFGSWQIPSTYGPERLDLLRQLEKMKEMETSELNTEENVDELA